MNCYQKILQKNVYRACAGNCDEIASVTTFHRNDKIQVVMARSLVPRGHLGFCHYERSEVIQKQMLIASRLLLSLRSIAMTRFAGKNLGLVQDCHGE